ncbi:MAG TPA: Ig-like domain-containing protein, partial [Desulfobacterales bacterium]|nr:Ig-like domain-containing protein [Desulfobacterales bacterium]
VRFMPGTGLTIGYSTYRGALAARGSAAAPIVFTSNADTPAPGDWKALCFYDAADDESTVLENCVLEYGGATYNSAVYCYQAAPTIRNSAVRFSAGHGISLYTSTAVLDGNTISGNTLDGVYGDSGSRAQITNTMLLENGGSGLNLHPDSVRLTSGNSGSGNGRHDFQIRGGNVTASGVWAKQPLPYVLSGDVTVRGSASETARLTIAPGAEVRFASGTGLMIGYGSYKGALLAQGTDVAPIVFTSDAAAPAPGDWKAIYFGDATDDALSVLEHCVVEYGGASYNANVYCYAASPGIQFNTIRNSRHAGLYLSGKGSDNAVVACNNFKDNPYGVYLAGGATTAIHRNNFLRNPTSGIHNTGSGEVHAENNWWGDDAGPGQAGDAVSGHVTAAPWLTAQADCIDLPPTNSPPFVPQNPFPANGAVRVPIRAEGEALAVVLAWSGGDPNPWDAVVYDIYMGEGADALYLLASGIEKAEFSRTDLAEGTHYFWRVVARDDAGLESAGPIWRFTTLGSPPDLTVSGVVLQPASGIEAGQQTTLAAEVRNSGTGPVVDPFWVDFSIDDESIGKIRITEVLPAGGAVTVSRAWTAMVGEHALVVSADSTGQVAEESDENNTFWQPLPLVVDTTPPEVSHADPADGASRAQVERISFTLLDRFGGSVDTAAVSASVVVSDDGGGLVDGSLAAAGSQFTFTPAVAPLADGRYRVEFTAVDTAGNARDHALTFTVDGEAPGGLTITGGVVASGVIQVRPAANRAKSGSITLTGTREDLTSVWVNNRQRVAMGSGEWSTVLYLPEGESALEVWLQDRAGNRSASVWVDLLVDSVAPVVTSLLPTHGSFLKLAPTAIAVEFEEATSGLDLAASLLALHDGDQAPVTGEWAAAGNQLSFVPRNEIAESSYTITLQLQDALGNRGAAVESHFTVDATPPPAPEVGPVQSPTPAVTQVIGGAKEAHAAILLNGAEVVGHTPETTWACSANLVSGSNRLTFLARDQAGNHSQSTAVEIVCDDLPPPAVSALTADGRGSGTTVALSWAGYDEAAHGDVAGYRIYHQTQPFADVSDLNVRATVAAGQFNWRAEGLVKGALYWFAVVAVDRLGNALTAVSPVSAAPSDGVAPEDVVGLAVSAYDDRLGFTWQPSADSAGDLAGYRVFFNAAPEGGVLSADQTAFEIGGLSPATAYPFRICALDHDGNQSAGASLTGITLLENPLGLSADARSGAVDLVWQGVQPAAYVKHYRVYVSQSTFATVAGMRPVFATGATSARVAGLTDHTPSWIAVTSVNLAGGERQSVAPVTVTPLADTEGPQISSVRVGETPLAAGQRFEKPAVITVAAADPAGVSRVTFSLDGVVFATAYNAPYSGFFDIAPIADGSHTLSVSAHDTLGNSTTLEFPIQIAMAPPEAPRITHPLGGEVTSQPGVMVAGRAEKGTAVRLHLNGAPYGSPAAVDLQGLFNIRAALVEGENRLWATAENRAGIGPASPEVRLTLDTSLPRSPLGLSAQARAGGEVRLSWQIPPQETVAGFVVYRSAAPFAAFAAAEKVTAQPITDTVFDDLPPQDGTWYYRVAAVDAAANQSLPSNQAAAASDGTPPRALAILYTPQGNADPESGAMAPGKVLVDLTVSEALQVVPFLSITPEGGLPLAVELTQADETRYSGVFTIFESTPTAAAYAVFSARDLAGNRGTEIDEGASIAIDTDGPAVTRLTLTPPEPIKNDPDDPVTISLDFGLNEALAAGTLPLIECRLSGEGRPPLPVTAPSEIAPRPGERQRWQAHVTLPADAGLGASETLLVAYQGRDGLGNRSDRILCQNRFQIYQGGLPPLSPPEGVAATALPGGRIRLAWQAVDGAAGYQVYRQAPGQSALAAHLRCDEVLEWVDEPGQEGLFRYAIASVRQVNGEVAESTMSAPAVEALADATPPEAPWDLSLELTAQGVRAAWQAPAGTEPLTYRLYRSDLATITTVADLSPVMTGITQPAAVDSRPSPTAHSYVATALDAAGNESAPSNSAYLNAGLLPVATLEVVQTDNAPPVVSWTHPGGDAVGFELFLGAPDDGIRLNPALLTAAAFTDTGWSGDARTYTLVAVDANSDRSLGRTLTLPRLETSLGAGTRLKRGVMNRLVYAVENRSAEAVANARLKAMLAGRAHLSEPFAVAAGAVVQVPVTVGGYGELGDSEDLLTSLEITPHPGETVRIVRTSEIPVDDGALVLQVLSDAFTRGGTGQVRFALTNTGDAAIEIVTARSIGRAASDEITFYLLDADDNVLSVAAFKQALGAGVVTLANGASVARIGAGETFTSEPVALPVPANAPDAGVIRLKIDGVYHHLGRDDEVVMAGPGTRYGVILVDSAYLGAVTGIAPQISTGDQPVVIKGRALARDGGQPVPHVPLKLIITLNGFERSVAVFTAADGTFAHGFTPLAGEGGTYAVGVVHPDVTDRPLQGHFVISKLALSPTAATLHLPKNYPQRITLEATAGDGSEIRNLQLIWAATDQPQGVLPQGIHLTPEAPVAALGPRQSAELAFTLWADNTAAQSEPLVLRVQSDGDAGPVIWARVIITAHFSEAAPYLTVSPRHLETGVLLGASASENLVLANKGTADISDLTLSLVTPDGAPAPAWVQLNSAAALGTLAVGESREVALTFAPDAAVSEGHHTFQLRARGANLEPVDTRLFVAVTPNGIGGALFKVYDIYTGTLDADTRQPVQGLKGARVALQHETIASLQASEITDGSGEALFGELPAGRYKCRITAPNHQETISRVSVKPGMTAVKEIFLEYNLVTVVWSVTETTIADRYEIVLSATFETDVPAAVVVAEPAALTLPEMRAGDVLNGEFTLSNYGLV